MTDEEFAALESRIRLLATLYAALFGVSLLVIVAQATFLGHSPPTTILWALSLGGAIATRLYRGALLNRYNAEVARRNGGHRAAPLQ
jgi:hypothetical protein